MYEISTTAARKLKPARTNPQRIQLKIGNLCIANLPLLEPCRSGF
jgi:hypothetical protein